MTHEALRPFEGRVVEIGTPVTTRWRMGPDVLFGIERAEVLLADHSSLQAMGHSLHYPDRCTFRLVEKRLTLEVHWPTGLGLGQSAIGDGTILAGHLRQCAWELVSLLARRVPHEDSPVLRRAAGIREAGLNHRIAERPAGLELAKEA